MPSTRLAQLQLQLADLRAHLLPNPLDPTGIYPNQAQVATQALAYRVLCHAEIESYFEDRALETVEHARQTWETSKHVSVVALCLVAFSGREPMLPPSSLNAPNENRRKGWPDLIDVGRRFNSCVSQFNNFVRHENHGIKEKNLMALLLPIGVDPTKLDPVFLVEIESFGSLRGVAAHSSSRTAARQAVDPAEELRRVESLLPGISAIDDLIDELMNARSG